MSVVDSGVIVDLLAPPTHARQQRLLALLPPDGERWVAPDVLPFEVFAVLRRHVHRGALTATSAERRLAQLPRLPIEYLPTASLLRIAWSLRDNFGAADALYAASAIAADAPLITSDAKLASAAQSAGIQLIEV